MTIRLAIVGLGKIARDQHIPAIAGSDGIELAAIADPQRGASTALRISRRSTNCSPTRLR